MIAVRLCISFICMAYIPTVIYAGELVGSPTEEISIETSTENENTTLEIDFSESDDNSTCEGNCTTITNLTTLKPTKIPSIAPTTVSHKIKTTSSNKICSCDIQAKTCDINCCCDTDCNYSMRQIFDRCNDDVDRIYDTAFCDYTKFIYKNNTPYEWTVHQNGMFCVVKSNLPRHYYTQKEIKLKDLNDATLTKMGKFGWPSKSLQTGFSSNLSFVFLYGKSAWLIKDKLIVPWEIPSNFHTDSCTSTKHIKLLENIDTKCTQYYINNNNKQLDIYNYVQNISVVTMSPSSKYFNQKKLTLLEGCPKDVCIIYNMLLCNEFLQSCLKPNQNISLKYNCFEKNGTISCTHVLRKLQYNIHHNGTQGIKKVDVLFHLVNLSYSTVKPVFEQHFSVRFLWTNHSFNYSLQRSGNPGYIFKKPILIANLIEKKIIISKKPLNFSVNVTIQQNPYDITEIFLTSPANQKGKCILTNNTNIQIQFGVNIVTNCKVQEVIVIKSKGSKDTCQEIQRFLFKFWSIKPDNSTKLFGKYGNANVSILNDWGNVSYTTSPENILKLVRSVFSPHKSRINCINLCTKLKIDIFHRRSIVEDFHDQERIVWITYEFDNFKNYTFQVEHNRTLLDIPLRSEVTFYDVTTEKIKKYTEPPSLDIKLPYDFFYPFVKIESRSGFYKPSIPLLSAVSVIQLGIVNVM